MTMIDYQYFHSAVNHTTATGYARAPAEAEYLKTELLGVVLWLV
jgi:hypothetical protein